MHTNNTLSLLLCVRTQNIELIQGKKEFLLLFSRKKTAGVGPALGYVGLCLGPFSCSRSHVLFRARLCRPTNFNKAPTSGFVVWRQFSCRAQTSDSGGFAVSDGPRPLMKESHRRSLAPASLNLSEGLARRFHPLNEKSTRRSVWAPPLSVGWFPRASEPSRDFQRAKTVARGVCSPMLCHVMNNKRRSGQAALSSERLGRKTQEGRMVVTEPMGRDRSLGELRCETCTAAVTPVFR